MKTPQPTTECGFCLKVQKNKGGNKGYHCKKHTPAVEITWVRVHKKSDIIEARTDERNKVIEEIAELMKKRSFFHRIGSENYELLDASELRAKLFQLEDFSTGG